MRPEAATPEIQVAVETKGVSGQMIIDAVETITLRGLLRQKFVVNDVTSFSLSRSSKRPYEDLMILVDGDIKIDPQRLYSHIVIAHLPGADCVEDLDYGEDDVWKALWEYSDQLRDQLH